MSVRSLIVNTTGAAGSATGSEQTDVPVKGFIEAVDVDYDETAPATTDLTLKEASGLARTILELSDRNTDGLFNPVRELHEPDGTPVGQYGYFRVDGHLVVDVAGCDELTPAVTVQIHVIEDQ